jgi:hypothetical protein
MPQAGVLVALAKFDVRIHKTILSLGCRFGQLEFWLQNKDVPDGEIDQECAALANEARQLINSS